MLLPRMEELPGALAGKAIKTWGWSVWIAPRTILTEAPPSDQVFWNRSLGLRNEIQGKGEVEFVWQ